MPAKPPSASRSWRRLTSSPSRVMQPDRPLGLGPGHHRPAVRQAGQRAAAPRCRSRCRTGAGRPRCWLAAADAAMVRSSWDRPLRGPPAAIRCPNSSRSITRRPLRLGRGQVVDPVRDRAPAVPPARPGSCIAVPGVTSLSSSVSGSAGSHGLCWGRIRSSRAARPDRLDQHLEVGDLVLVLRRATCGRWRLGPPSPGPVDAGPARAARRRRWLGAGRRPPTRPAWNGTSDACPSRT